MSNIKKFRIKSFKNNNEILKLEKLSLKFGKKVILDNLSLQLNRGQILGLLGPNGVGKSTMFNLIIGLIKPDFGSIIINSEMVNKLILISAAGYPMKSKSIPLAFKIAQIPIIQNIFTFITPRFVAKVSVENVYKDKAKVSEELVDRYFELILREGNRQAFVDRFKVESDTISHKKIKLINQRTLILWGEDDKLIPLEMAYIFHNDLPNDTLVILKNSGHVPMEESPSESLIPVIEFLRKLRLCT